MVFASCSIRSRFVVLLAVSACVLSVALAGCGSGSSTQPATVVLTAGPNPSVVGLPVTLSAKVTSAAATPTGTVTFLDGGTALSTATLASGTASFQTSSLGIGTHSMTVKYGGDSANGSSVSAATSLSITLAATSGSVTVSPNPATSGQSVTMTAQIAGNGAQIPTGTVTFLDGGTALSTATLVNGLATLQTSSLAAGVHSITVAYGGDSVDASSTSPVTSLKILATTTTSISVSPNPATTSQYITLTAPVVSAGGPTPTGTVTFYVGSAFFATAPVTGGTATYTATTLLFRGTDTFYAVYSGDTSNVTSTSPTTTLTVNNSGSAGSIKVQVLAGSLPVNGASLQLYTAGTTGLGSAPTAQLTPALVTDSTGTAYIPATYSCSSNSPQLFLIARGGTVSGAAAANPALVLQSALGSCLQLIPNGSLTVNEVTTVGSAYALSQFMAASGSIGATSTNTTGITNAFLNALSLVDQTKGASPGPTSPANQVAVNAGVAGPSARIDSLANLLNTCTAQLAGNSCSQLFAAATPPGGVAPTDTLTAALNIVRNPGNNVATIYTLSNGSSAFASAASVQPSDWTLFLAFTGGGMNNPSGIGIDSLGNVRVSNYFNVASAFSPIGAPLAAYVNGVTAGNLGNSYGLAVDASDNAWIPNEPDSNNGYASNISVLNAAGASVAGSRGYTNGGLNYPISVAIDPNTTAWIVNYGNSTLTLLNPAGTPLSGASGYSSALFAFPVAVALDGNHNAWIANQSSNTVTEVNPSGPTFKNYTCCQGASGIAVDQRNNIWIANYYGASVSQISSTGAIVSNQAYKAGGNIDHPQGVAIDGGGNVWVTNFREAYLTELAGSAAAVPGAALSPSPGYAPDAGLLEAYAIAIDASGNIWITNFGSDTVTQFVGLATPVKTPLLGLPQLP
jgi:hypothetical protein